MEEYRYQIIIQTQPNVNIKCKENSFIGEGKAISSLNNALKTFNFSITQITSRASNIGAYKQFRLLTNETPTDLIEIFLNCRDIIDGAYEKGFAEDTGI
ncbi:MAG: hypothetical protein MK105_15975 [Crocinitomicaceae bacterium]|nr:hypothetical protein [Crocinitomicaceae bacterium]